MLRPRYLVGALALTAGAFAAVQPLVQEMPQPTEHHRRIMHGVGSWEGVLTMYDMPGAPEEGMQIPCSENVEALGQFWTVSDFKCDFMGMPFHGKSTMGYDPMKEKYVGTWVDTMSTYLSVMEGEYDEEKNAVVMTYMAPDMTGELVPHRNEFVHRGDAYVMKFYKGEGEGTHTMTIKMKRKAEATEAGHDGHGGGDHDGDAGHDAKRGR